MRPLDEVLREWEAVIGLEIHTALTTLETKLFCGCRLSRDDEPNAQVCPVCLGLPGALPVPNAAAVRSIVMAGLALGCEVPRRSMFYRKHYFYPDMAKNFQTTQGPVAFCMRGRLDLELAGDAVAECPVERLVERPAADGKARTVRAADGTLVVPIRIQRIHLEEDAAKMVHLGGAEGRIGGAAESLIDYNRCGTPLIELVTEPDLRTPAEARRFMEQLRETFLALGISDCSLERGSMRCDGNVSLRRPGETGFGTKTELKNLNSFKSLHDGLAYEICRQAELLESGGSVRQETRHWEPSRHRTLPMRAKETVDDYRFFPDPDLAPFELSEAFVEDCRARMPELPRAKRLRYVADFGIRKREARQIAADPDVARLFEGAAGGAGPELARMVANVLVNLVPAVGTVSARQLRQLAELLARETVSFAQARELLEEVAGSEADPAEAAEARGWGRTSDDAALAALVEGVLASCPDQVRQYREGKTKVIGYLVGRCVKASAGAGNPKLLKRALEERLGNLP